MSAGASARYEAQRSLLEAGEYERLAHQAREQAARYEVASRSEAVVGARLRALESVGWRVLEDRRWAGSRRANVDFLLVGPGGVVVVDVKAWRALQVVNNSLFCEDECRDDEAAKLLSLVDRVQDSIAELGVTPQTLHPALVFSGRRVLRQLPRLVLLGEYDVAAWATRLGRRLNEEQVEQVYEVLDRDFPTYDVAPRRPVAVPPVRVVMPKQAQVAVDSLFDVDELTEALIEAHLAGPIEDWMTFLHPDQLKLVNTSWSGPARVRGPAGTGKTVVGLHRAVFLAQRTQAPVLFVTFVRTLPVVLAGLCERLAPAVRERIHFTGLHRLAVDIIESNGTRVLIDDASRRRAFREAWNAVGRQSVLVKLDERPAYWQEELDYVIKGRGLTDFGSYAELARVGRRAPMRMEHREAMWAVYVEYERLLRAAGIQDFNDVLITARDLLRTGQAEATYGAVIVDEVQDLCLVGLELLQQIAGDGPDRLLLIGDGQQNVYPGGFNLAEAGISVAGRASVLRVNYRNTMEILETATLLVAGDQYDDLDGEVLEGARDAKVHRHGHPPMIIRSNSASRMEEAMVEQILATRTRLRVPLGDMAVLVRTNKELQHYCRLLTRKKIEWVNLLHYDGVTIDRLKIGTFKRAKGLEFKYVLLPGLRGGALDPWPGESDAAFEERSERTRRELFVGMTRARDGLWLGYLDG